MNKRTKCLRHGWFFIFSFHKRRAEIRELTARLHNGDNSVGGARIDEDGRLVRVTEPPEPPQDNMPQDNGDDANRENNFDANRNENPEFLPRNILDDQQENLEELILQQKRRETMFAIEKAVEDLRNKNDKRTPVPEEEFEIILLDARGCPIREEVAMRLAGGFTVDAQNNEEGGAGILMNPMLHRIAIATIISITVVFCAALQVLPIKEIFRVEESVNPVFDSILNEVLDVRGWKDHVRECAGGLANRSDNRHYNAYKWEWLRGIQNRFSFGNTSTDCSKGVLHIPSKRVLDLDTSSSIGSEMDLRDYARGVNVSWFIPCSGHSIADDQQQCDWQNGKDIPAYLSLCHGQNVIDKCFRGVHDNFVEDDGIHSAFRMADILIERGWDHFDIHYDVSYLYRMIPATVEKVKNLLYDTYLSHHEDEHFQVGKNIRPIAFRVLTTAPMDGHDVTLEKHGDQMRMYISKTTSALNETNYLNWVLKSRRHNDRALRESYYLPRPYRLQPKRETCNLKFDLQADSRFCIQSSIFLTDGAGQDHWGGTNLFVDDHPENFANPSRRIARGLSIDGSKGRLVVSTGGFENLRCRFPTRGGFRSVLQIWWDC